MQKLSLPVCLIVGLLVASVQPAAAQAPTGNISGRATSSDGLPLPGVVVTVTSQSAPGARTTVTSENGDYLFALLPPGMYTISFVLDGFQELERTQNIGGTQNARLDVTMSPAGVSVSVDVVADADAFVQTAQVATNFKQDLMAALPSNRTIDAVLLMAPAVHPTGPRGAYTINGSQSYENLYILNGAVINENLRGLPMTPYIEDAIQEVTVASSGVSAEYGRFAGGVATAVTKSGGNTFGGSFRTTMANDSWRSFTPFESDAIRGGRPGSDLKLDATVPTYEATFGGPVQTDRLWFFSAMRSQVQKSKRTTSLTNIPYTFTNDEQRYEGKLTYAPKTGHSVQGSYLKLTQLLDNNAGFSVADTRSLTKQGQPQSLMSLQYTGVVSPSLSFSAQYSSRQLTFTDVGATATDDINGTLVLDISRNVRFWSPTFCSGSVCGDGDEQRDNHNVVLKGSYFLSNGTSGSHHVVFGYDYFNDNITANTHASGSSYRLRATSSITRGDEIFPVLVPNAMTTLDYNPLAGISEGSNLRMHSLFVNDSWHANEHLTLNLGVRLDKNDATDGDGDVVGDDVSFSPRLSAVWDPNGDGRWALNGSVARYTMALTSNVVASTAAGGNAETRRFVYTGPAVNIDPNAATESLVTTEQALATVFAWHGALGGSARPPAFANLPGVNVQIENPLSSPYAMEYASGIARSLGGRGNVRADLVYRDFRNFYALRTDLETGRVTDAAGNRFDLNVIENTDRTERQYLGLSTQAIYDFGSSLSLGGNYTISRAWGDVEGETVNGGPSGGMTGSYPEYRVASWNYPTGDLMIDQRHRARMWATYQVPASPSLGTFSVGLLQQFATGAPYPAVAIFNPTAYVTNPGYLTPPAGLEYYLLGRNPFRTEATYRTDLAVNYGYRFGRAGDFHPEVFFHGEVLNLLNQYQLCGCGENVFRNGGISDLTTIGTGVRVTAPFNPYQVTPVEGTHWERTTLGLAANRFAYTMPRMFRFSVGIRF